MAQHLIGSTERRLICLRIAASMLRRVTKDDKAPTPEQLVDYAKKLEEYAYRGEGRSG